MSRRIHADFIRDGPMLRLTLLEEGREIGRRTVHLDDEDAARELRAAFVPLPWTADLTVLCNFSAVHWGHRHPTLLCDAVLAAARLDRESVGA